MASSLPKISIVTPSYNQAGFIEETILSVLDQNYPNLEYWVFDGGSTDGTVEILRKYEGRLHWVSRKDRGQSDALNQGFRQARGEILAYLNSDDRYEPGALLKVGDFMRSHPKAYWLTGKCRIIDANGIEIRQPITLYKNFWLFFRNYKILLILDYVSQPATFWHREVIQKIGIFDESVHFSMDYDYSLRAGQFYKLWVIDDYLASFRIHPAAKSDQIIDYFNADYAMAQRYAPSRALQRLHRLHNAVITRTYTLMRKFRK